MPSAIEPARAPTESHEWPPPRRRRNDPQHSTKRVEAQQERRAREREERVEESVEKQVDFEERQQGVIADAKTTYDCRLYQSGDAEPREYAEPLYRFYGAKCFKCYGGSDHFDYMTKSHNGLTIYHTQGRGGRRSGYKIDHPFDRYGEPWPARAALLAAARAKRAPAEPAEPAEPAAAAAPAEDELYARGDPDYDSDYFERAGRMEF